MNNCNHEKKTIYANNIGIWTKCDKCEKILQMKLLDNIEHIGLGYALKRRNEK